MISGVESNISVERIIIHAATKDAFGIKHDNKFFVFFLWISLDL